MSDSAAPVAPAAPSSTPSTPTTSATPAASAAAPSPVTTKTPGSEAPAAGIPFPKRQYKGKVDKEERVWELSDEEVAVRLQKSEASEKRFQAASEKEKKWAQLQQFAREDLGTFIKEVSGVDPTEWAQKQVEEKWKLEVMPEHERKVYELEQKLKAYETSEQKRAQEAKVYAERKASAALEAQIEADFKRAFEVSGLEYTPDNLEVFGQLVLAAHDNNLEYTPEQLAAEAKSRLAERDGRYETKLKERFTGLKGSDLLSYLGDATVKEVLKAAVARHTAAQQPAQLAVVPQAPGTTNTDQPRDSRGKFLTTSDWRKSFR